MGTTESRASSIHPSTPTFLSAAAAALPLRLLQCRPHSIHECGGRLGEGCDCVASTLEGRRDRHVVLVDPVMELIMRAATTRLEAAFCSAPAAPTSNDLGGTNGFACGPT